MGGSGRPDAVGAPSGAVLQASARPREDAEVEVGDQPANDEEPAGSADEEGEPGAAAVFREEDVASVRRAAAPPRPPPGPPGPSPEPAAGVAREPEPSGRAEKGSPPV